MKNHKYKHLWTVEIRSPYPAFVLNEVESIGKPLVKPEFS